MASHRIHLKGPWDFVLQASSDADTCCAATEGTARMPQAWQALFGNVSGTAQFRRKFHRPTNLEPHEQVILVLTEVRGHGHVDLNDVQVGQFATRGDCVEFDITPQLNPFNELTVQISFDPHHEPDSLGGLFGAVALDIRTEDH